MNDDNFNMKDFLPFWDSLKNECQETILKELKFKAFKKGETVHDNSVTCTGLIFILSGKLRSYMISETGRELSLYYLMDNDICLMSASCVMKDITFDIFIEAMEETKAAILPTHIYKDIANNYIEMSKYVNSIMSSRLSDVMWILEQVLFKKFDSRLAEFLLFHRDEEDKIKMTHEEIANHLGSAREVVSRMLKHFESNDIIKLFRGGIEILNKDELIKLSN